MSRSQRFFQLPGVSFVALGMPAGLIHGIEIDNSSGSWLLIPTLETFVPPFTIGWRMDIPYGATSIDIVAGGLGPASQVSTSQGSGVTVFLSGEAVGASQGTPDPSAAGTAFIEGFTPNLTDYQVISVPFSTGSLVTLLPGIANKRYRVHTLSVSLKPSGGNPPEQFDSGGLFAYHCETTLDVYATGRLNLNHPSDTQIFPSGLDFPIGLGIVLQAIADYAQMQLGVTTTYSVI